MFPTVTLILLLHRSGHLSEQIRDTLRMFDNFVVVDNGSRDGLLESLETHFPTGTFLRSASNVGFGAGNNLGLREVKTRYCLVANPDASFSSSAIESALSVHRAFDRVGVVGGRIHAESGECASFDWDYEPTYARPFAAMEGLVCAKWVYGCFMLFNTDAFRRVGFFDSQFFLYYEEWDVCRRLSHAGFQVLASPDVEVKHVDGHSSLPSFRTKFLREYHWLRSKRLYLRKFPHPRYREKPRWVLFLHGLFAFASAALLLRKDASIKALARLKLGLSR